MKKSSRYWPLTAKFLQSKLSLRSEVKSWSVDCLRLMVTIPYACHANSLTSALQPYSLGLCEQPHVAVEQLVRKTP